MRCFVNEGYWKWLVTGFGHTIIITLFAVLIGFVFGIVLAAIRSSYDKSEESLKIKGGFGYHFLKFLNIHRIFHHLINHYEKLLRHCQIVHRID